MQAAELGFAAPQSRSSKEGHRRWQTEAWKVAEGKPMNLRHGS
jgi:hypothetical protein